MVLSVRQYEYTKQHWVLNPADEDETSVPYEMTTQRKEREGEGGGETHVCLCVSDKRAAETHNNKLFKIMKGRCSEWLCSLYLFFFFHFLREGNDTQGLARRMMLCPRR